MTEIRDDYKAFLKLYNGVFKGKDRPSKIALRYQLSVMELDDGKRVLIPAVADILYSPTLTRDEKILNIADTICGNLKEYKDKQYYLDCDGDEDLLAIVEATDTLIDDVKSDKKIETDNQDTDMTDIDDTLLNAVVNMDISPLPLPISSIKPTQYKKISTVGAIKEKPTNSYNAYRYDETTEIPDKENLPPGMALIENPDYPIRKSQLGEQPNPIYTQPQNIYNLVRRPETTYIPRPPTLPINSYVFNPASGSSGYSGSSGSSASVQKPQVKTTPTTTKKTVKKAPKNTLQNKIKKVRTRCRTQKKVKNPRKPTVQKKDCKKINDTISMIKNIKL